MNKLLIATFAFIIFSCSSHNPTFALNGDTSSSSINDQSILSSSQQASNDGSSSSSSLQPEGTSISNSGSSGQSLSSGSVNTSTSATSSGTIAKSSNSQATLISSATIYSSTTALTSSSKIQSSSSITASGGLMINQVIGATSTTVTNASITLGATSDFSLVDLSVGTLSAATWDIGDISIASVNTDGSGIATVTGLSVGSTTLHGKDNSLREKTIALNIIRPTATSVSIIQAGSSSIFSGPLNLNSPNTSQFSASVLPVQALQTLTWSSSKPSVATVDQSGLVTAVSSGSADISATTANWKTSHFKIFVDGYTGIDFIGEANAIPVPAGISQYTLTYNSYANYGVSLQCNGATNVSAFISYTSDNGDLWSSSLLFDGHTQTTMTGLTARIGVHGIGTLNLSSPCSIAFW